MTPFEKKNILLKMALADDKKPVPCSKDEAEAVLGRALNSYICKKSSCYDKEFTQKIRIIKLSWLENPSIRKKRLLLEMAANKEDKPSHMSEYAWEEYMGVALMSYVSKTNCCYDEKFRKQLYRINPDWFIGTKENFLKKKQKLLDMAASKKRKPSVYSRDKEVATLAHSLRGYLNKARKSYDKDFERKIKALAPGWFAPAKERMAKKKKLLLKLAKDGAPKPTISNKDDKIKTLARALASYSGKSQPCYDSKFDKKIRELRPDWFRR